MTIEEQIDIAITHLTDIKKVIDEKLSNLQKAKDALHQATNKTDNVDAAKTAELDKLEWKDAREGKTGAWVYADSCPDWFLRMLNTSEKKSVTIAGFDYRLSTPKPTQQFPEPKSFVWRYTHRETEKK